MERKLLFSPHNFTIIITTNRHRMSQLTNVRSNNHIQVKILHKMNIHNHEPSALLMQTPIGHKNVMMC